MLYLNVSSHSHFPLVMTNLECNLLMFELSGVQLHSACCIYVHRVSIAIVRWRLSQLTAHHFHLMLLNSPQPPTQHKLVWTDCDTCSLGQTAYFHFCVCVCLARSKGLSWTLDTHQHCELDIALFWVAGATHAWLAVRFEVVLIELALNTRQHCELDVALFWKAGAMPFKGGFKNKCPG